MVLVASDPGVGGPGRHLWWIKLRKVPLIGAEAGALCSGRFCSPPHPPTEFPLPGSRKYVPQDLLPASRRAPDQAPPQRVAPGRRSDEGETLHGDLQRHLNHAHLAAITAARPDSAGALYLQHLLQVHRDTGLELTGYLPWNAPPSWSRWVQPYYRVLWAERERPDAGDPIPLAGPDSALAPAAALDAAESQHASTASGEARLVSRLAGLEGGADEDEEGLASWFQRTIDAAGPGRSPSEQEQRFLEQVHGRPLSEARIHEGGAARDLAGAVAARAFTVGLDIFLPDGARLDSPDGAELLAHEATHVIQAAEGRLPEAPASGLAVSDPSQAHEREAEARGREARDLVGDPWGLREAQLPDAGGLALLMRMRQALPPPEVEPPAALVDELLQGLLQGRLAAREPGVPDEAALRACARQAPYPNMLRALTARLSEISGAGSAAAAGEPEVDAGDSGEIPYRAQMERFFGEDFSEVEARTGAAAELAQLGADGAAAGEAVAFREHRPSPELVAHELTHVVQARGAPAGPVSGTTDPASAIEQEARGVAAAFEGGADRAPAITGQLAGAVARGTEGDVSPREVLSEEDEVKLADAVRAFADEMLLGQASQVHALRLATVQAQALVLSEISRQHIAPIGEHIIQLFQYQVPFALGADHPDLPVVQAELTRLMEARLDERFPGTGPTDTPIAFGQESETGRDSNGEKSEIALIRTRVSALARYYKQLAEHPGRDPAAANDGTVRPPPSPQRQRMAAIALGEVGKTNYGSAKPEGGVLPAQALQDTGPRPGVPARTGWRHVKKYFDGAGATGLTEDAIAHTIHGTSWCGIFAVWAANMAGFNLAGWDKEAPSSDPQAPPPNLRSGSPFGGQHQQVNPMAGQAPQIGDIVNRDQATLNHFGVITWVDEAAVTRLLKKKTPFFGDVMVETVQGNHLGGQVIRERTPLSFWRSKKLSDPKEDAKVRHGYSAVDVDKASAWNNP
jgi:hypothetical protein